MTGRRSATPFVILVTTLGYKTFTNLYSRGLLKVGRWRDAP